MDLQSCSKPSCNRRWIQNFRGLPWDEPPESRDGPAEDIGRKLHHPAEDVEVIHLRDAEPHKQVADETLGNEEEQDVVSVLAQEAVDLAAALI